MIFQQAKYILNRMRNIWNKFIFKSALIDTKPTPKIKHPFSMHQKKIVTIAV